MNARLLLVDFQNDYLATSGLEPDAASLVRRAAILLARCRELGVPVIHVWTTVSRADDRRMRHWKREGRWMCEEGTTGHAPPPELTARDGETVVHKSSFSAFATGDLGRVLEREHPALLVIAGVHLHACVRQLVLDCYERFESELWVAEDATGSNDPLHAAITRRYLERRAARFLPVDEACAELERLAVPSLQPG
jgi:nicotinamidase-related amidase